jgi:hypothetical protein
MNGGGWMELAMTADERRAMKLRDSRRTSMLSSAAATRHVTENQRNAVGTREDEKGGGGVPLCGVEKRVALVVLVHWYL